MCTSKTLNVPDSFAAYAIGTWPAAYPGGPSGLTSIAPTVPTQTPPAVTVGGYIPPGGTLLQLQYRVAGYPEGWAPFDVLVHSRRNGTWSTTVTLPRNAAHFTYMIRAVISAQNGWPWTGAVTNVVTRRVLG
jgi:hypothetical protein